MKKILFLIAALCALPVFAEKITSYNFSIVRNEISVGRSIFYNIEYSPHKSISPIHVYIISNEELSFTEEELASVFEYLGSNSYFYNEDEVLSPLHLSNNKYEVITKSSGRKDSFVFLRQKL